MERALAHLPDMIITGAYRVKEELMSLGVPSGKIKVVCYGVDIDAFREASPSGY